jgi:heme/copper-type cytochrome/quinol oxidase subunit 1
MTIIETRPHETGSHAVDAPAVAGARQPSGLQDWLTTGDHVRVARTYIVLSLLVLLGMLVIGAVLGLERIDGGGVQLLELDAIAQLYSLYGYGLVFGAVLPLLLGLAIGIVPLQVGARTIAFPRAAAASLWTWVAGVGVMIGGYAANGGPGGGNADGVDLFLVGLMATTLALSVAAMCVATTVLTLRAPGMTLIRVPALAWSALVAGVMLLLTLPVLLAMTMLAFVDHRYMRVFASNLEVGSLLDWSLRQPQVYVYGVIGLGVIAEIVPVFTRTRLRLGGVVFALIALFGAVGFGGYAVPAFREDIRFEVLFILVSLLAVLPLLGLLALIAVSLKGGKPKAGGALVWAVVAWLMGFVAVAAGALTPIRGLELQGTTYELSQFNYVLLGLGVLAGLGGVVFWGPKLFGRKVANGPATGLALLGLVGVVLTAFPDIILGFQDQPFGEVNWEAGETFGAQQIVNAVHGIGAALLALVVLAFVGLAFAAFVKGEEAGSDPWDGHTLEWATTSPPPAGNFAGPLPEVTSDRPLLDEKERA